MRLALSPIEESKEPQVIIEEVPEEEKNGQITSPRQDSSGQITSPRRDSSGQISSRITAKL